MIRFENDGVLDPRSITTFGVNSKDNNSAIGYFGTGLKYAIAVLVREGYGIKIISGGNEYTFDVSREKIRNDEFSIVRMNDVCMGFTTELGKNWEVWQAFRELYCNCTDEHGVIYRVGEFTGTPKNPETSTIIEVEGGEFEKSFDNKDKFILSSKPIYSNSRIEIHQGSTDTIFYKGIAVYNNNEEFLYTYNIKEPTKITEDRTLKSFWDFGFFLGTVVPTITDYEVLKNILYAPEGYYENDMTLYGNSVESKAFDKICKDAAERFDTKINRNARKRYKGWMNVAFSANPCELNDIEEKMLKRAKNFCAFIGHDTSSYEIHVTEVLGENVLGMAYDNKIYLAKRVFMQGTKQVAVTLLEEYLHLKYNLVDETYKMQTFLFDVIGGLGERLKGEPL